MFGGKKKKMENNIPAPKLKVEDDIYVMPEKFNPRKVKNTSSNKTLVIVLIIFVLIALSSGIYFLSTMWLGDTGQPLANTEVTDNTNETLTTGMLGINTNINANPDIEDDIILEEVIEEEDIIEEEPVDLPETSKPILPPQISSDADRDGLTDLEESVLGTNSSRPDSDGDGYLDGDEFVSGYNPAVASGSEGSALVDASFISTLTTNFTINNFSVSYITDWAVNYLEALSQVRITIGTGEIIKISVEENKDQVSAPVYYLNNNPQVLLSQLKTVSVGDDLSGIFSPNGLEVYLTDASREKLYIFEYVLDNEMEFRYPNIFKMIIGSLKVVEVSDLPIQGEDVGDQATSTPPIS